MIVKQQQSLIHYRIQWKPSGHQPGMVRGTSAGIGDRLRALVLLRDHPDPRRLDLRASLRDPFERLFVRDFYLNTAFKVIVLLDTSASMGFKGEVARFEVAQEIAKNLAFSAYRSGDAFGLYCANQTIVKEATIPPRLNRSAWLTVQHKLSALIPRGDSVDGLLNVAALLPKNKSLVFVVSDFRWETVKFQQLLKNLSHHDVVPILLQDPVETHAMPQKGLATVVDLETGQSKFVWMREGLIQQLKSARQQHWLTIKETSARFGYQPFLVNGHFDGARLTQYFLSRNG
jgi:uncharacterized protein (DUF58 family)